MKYALDTSVLVRILVNRPQPLASDVIDEVSRRIAEGDTMAVPNLVLSEAYYAVQHHPRFAIAALDLGAAVLIYCWRSVERRQTLP